MIFDFDEKVVRERNNVRLGIAALFTNKFPRRCVFSILGISEVFYNWRKNVEGSTYSWWRCLPQ